MAIQAPKGETCASLWHVIFDSAEDAMVLCTSEGAVCESNRQAKQILNEHGLLQGGRISDSFPDQYAERIGAILGHQLSGRESLGGVKLEVEGEFRGVFDLIFSRVGAEQWLLTIKDVSRRWRNDAHLLRLTLAMDASADAYFLTDAEYRISYANGGFHSATGHQLEDILGRTAEFLRAPEHRPKVREYIAGIEAGKRWSGEIKNVRRDGTSYHVEANISPLFDPDGELLGYVACERDVEPRKRLQEEVLSQRHLSHSILHSINAAVYAVDRQFRLKQVNETWRQLPAEHGWLKVEQPPVEGMPIIDLIASPAKRVELKLVFDGVLRTGEPIEMCCSSNGRHWLVKISPWQHGGKIAGLIYQVTDQTRLNELQTALLQAQKLKTIGSLAAGIAHDFNNLLLVIRGNTSLLLRERKNTETDQKYLQNIDQASLRAAEITQQLLAFNSSSAENTTVFDFNEVILQVEQLIGRSQKSNIATRTVSWEKPVKVEMDSSRAHQVILNLCLNAQEAMQHGGTLEITNALVTLSQQQAAQTDYPAGTAFLRCTVKDTGIGIKPEFLPKIFDPFFTTKETGQGTGLGLSIVHGIVTQAGGFFEVESKPGKGTSFHVFLPTVESEITLGNASEGPLPQCSGRVLIVDDLDLVLEFTCDFLKEIGFETFAARNADEALDVLKSEPIDLVLTDFNMPGISGLELISQVKQRWPKIQCILASGYLDESVEKRLVNEFQAGTLRKPYNVAEAADLVRKMLELR